MKKKLIILFLIIFNTNNNFGGRNIHRERDPQMGSIAVRYENDNEIYEIYDYRLKEFPLFKTYNDEYLNSKRIPGIITYRYEPEKSIKAEVIEKILANLLQEIEAGKQKFTDFKILKMRDFNWFKKCGLLVLKFNDFPFIFKLFIECPKSFVKPDKKSFQVRGVFVLGGTFRHIVGYTRVVNAENTEKRIKENPTWANKVKLPRKWFWTPKNNKWLIIEGRNLGGKDYQQIKLPATYGVLVDLIKEDNKKDEKIKKEYLKLCSDFDYSLDPLPSNFKLGDKGEIIIIDTEHFATLIGIQKKFKAYDKYSNYWAKIIGKYWKDRFLTLKSEKRKQQANNKHLYSLY